MSWIERIFGKKEKPYTDKHLDTIKRYEEENLKRKKQYIAPMYEPSPKSTGYTSPQSNGSTSDLLDPTNLLSPLNPISPFSIWNTDDSPSHSQDHNSSSSDWSSHSSSSHDYGSSSSDSSSYSSSDSSSYDSGNSSDSSSSSFD